MSHLIKKCCNCFALANTVDPLHWHLNLSNNTLPHNYVSRQRIFHMNVILRMYKYYDLFKFTCRRHVQLYAKGLCACVHLLLVLYMEVKF